MTRLLAALACAALAPATLRAQSAEWTAVLVVRPNPSPYLSDWEGDPSIVTLVLSYTGAGGVAFHLTGAVRRAGGAPLVAGRSAPFEFVQPSQLLLSTRDGIWESGSVRYESSFRDGLARTGRIPDGEYEFCVEVREGLPENAGAQLARECAPFTIVAPQPPSLVLPLAGDTVRTEYPTFAWTPVSGPPNDRIAYHARIVELLPGQTPLEALNNLPHHEEDLATTSFLYPPSALPLRAGELYAWQVQAVDGAGQPVGERQGKSEIGWFAYRPATVAARPPVVGADSSVGPEPVVSRFTWSGVEVKVLRVYDSTRTNFSGVGRVTIVPRVFEPRIRFQSLRLTEDRRRVAYAPRHTVRMPDVGSVWDWNNVLPLPLMLQVESIDLVADSASGASWVGVNGSGVVITSYASPTIPAAADDSAARAAEKARADSVAAAEAENAAAVASQCATYAAMDTSAMTEMERWNLSSEYHFCTEADSQATAGDWEAASAAPATLGDAGPAPPTSTPEAPERSLEERAEAAYDRAVTIKSVYDELRRRHLYFRFRNLRVDANGPGGTLILARDWQSADWGMPGFMMTFYRDRTRLALNAGVGTLDLKGDFRIPPRTGLVRDETADIADSVANDGKPDTKVEQTAADSALVLEIREARLSTQGELYIAAGGLPRARVGRTGLELQTGDAWIDLSSELSPPGRDPSWQGVYFDSARVALPRTFHTAGIDSATRADSTRAQVVGYRLAVDASGFSGVVAASDLARLGPMGFGGFSGGLDSLRFEFSSGTLDSGYVRGRLTVPLIEGEIPYWVSFTPDGVGAAYAALSEQQAIRMPALQATARIQRGEFTYGDGRGVFDMDLRLDIEREGIRLREAQVYGLKIGSDGRLALDRGWVAFETADAADFKGFPVALDSIGFGSAASGNESWLGVAGRFQLNENLPSGSGAFRVFAARSAAGSPWRFDRVSVDKLDLQFRNAAVEFRGLLDYVTNDPVYGDAFKAGVTLDVKEQIAVAGNFIVGSTRQDSTGAGPAPFRYWYVDAKLALPPPGVQLGTLPLSLYGFGGGAYSRMRASIDTLTLAATYVPDPTVGFGLKALVSLGTSASQGFVWNADATLEAAVAPSGGLQSLSLRGDNWMLTEVSRREKKIWGTVLIDLPVSRPVLHANMTLNVDLRPAMRGQGWAELHFAPGNDWYVNVGTPQRPDSLILLPGALDLKSTAFFMMDNRGVDAGFATFLEKERREGIFYGRVAAGYEAEATLRYRPFLAAGEGELWGEIVAKVKDYTLLSGTARATMGFRMPDPMGIEGKVRVRYRLLGGTLRGTYRMRYSWGAGTAEGSDTSQFVVLASTFPASGDTMAPPIGATFYLGMSEGTEYGTEDGDLWRMRLTGTPSLARGVTNAVRTCQGVRVCTTTPTVQWISLGTPVREWDEERSALTLKAPGFAPLEPATRYRATARFVLEKWQGGSWVVQQTVDAMLPFTTAPGAVSLAQLVGQVDPPGAASPFYHGGPNAGAVRVRFTNVHPDLTSGAIRATVTAGDDTVRGSWGRTTNERAATRLGSNDPTLWAFTPVTGGLLPSTSYRFSLHATDSTRREVLGVGFRTSNYASLAEHLAQSAQTVTAERGPGPASGTGRYLLRARAVLASAEPITWADIDSIEVIGASAGWEVTPRTRCQWSGGTAPMVASLGTTVEQLCGKTPVYENVLTVSFSATTDAELPPAGTASLAIRLNHRREGWHSVTLALPADTPRGPTLAGDVRTAAVTPTPSVDVTGVKPVSRTAP